MRKSLILMAIVIFVGLVFSSVIYAKSETGISSEDAEQTLLRLLFNPAREAIEEYYGEPRQYWRDKILSVQRVPNSGNYKVVMQVETFYGPHNPPYGIETMTFYIGLGKIQLHEFKHQDEPD